MLFVTLLLSTLVAHTGAIGDISGGSGSSNSSGGSGNNGPLVVRIVPGQGPNGESIRLVTPNPGSLLTAGGLVSVSWLTFSGLNASSKLKLRLYRLADDGTTSSTYRQLAENVPAVSTIVAGLPEAVLNGTGSVVLPLPSELLDGDFLLNVSVCKGPGSSDLSRPVYDTVVLRVTGGTVPAPPSVKLRLPVIGDTLQNGDLVNVAYTISNAPPGARVSFVFSQPTSRPGWRSIYGGPVRIDGTATGERIAAFRLYVEGHPAALAPGNGYTLTVALHPANTSAPFDAATAPVLANASAASLRLVGAAAVSELYAFASGAEVPQARSIGMGWRAHRTRPDTTFVIAMCADRPVMPAPDAGSSMQLRYAGLSRQFFEGSAPPAAPARRAEAVAALGTPAEPSEHEAQHGRGRAAQAVVVVPGAIALVPGEYCMVLMTGQQRYFASTIFPADPSGDTVTLVYTPASASVGSVPWNIPLSAGPPMNTSYFLVVSVVHPAADPVATPVPPEAAPGVSPVMVINTTTPLAPMRRARSTLFRVVAGAAASGSITASVDASTVAVRQQLRIGVATTGMAAGTPVTVALHRTTLAGGLAGAEATPFVIINGSMPLGSDGTGGTCNWPSCSASFSWTVPQALNTAVSPPDLPSLLASATRFVLVVSAPSTPTLRGRALLTVLASEPGTVSVGEVTSSDNLRPGGQGLALRPGANVTLTWSWSGPIGNYSMVVSLVSPLCAAASAPRAVTPPGGVPITAGRINFRLPPLDSWPSACLVTPASFAIAAVPPTPAQMAGGTGAAGNASSPIQAPAPWFQYVPPITTLNVALGRSTPLQPGVPLRGALQGLQVGGRYANAVLLPGDAIPIAAGAAGLPDDATVTLTLLRVHGGFAAAASRNFNASGATTSVIASVTVPAAQALAPDFSFGTVQAAWLTGAAETLSLDDGTSLTAFARSIVLRPIDTAAAEAVDARARATAADMVAAPPARYLRVILRAIASGGIVAPDSAPFAVIALDSALQAAVVQAASNVSAFASLPSLRAGMPFVVSWSIAGLQDWSSTVAVTLHNDIIRPDGSALLRLASGIEASARRVGAFALPLALNASAPADAAFYIRVTVEASTGNAAAGNAALSPLFTVLPPLAGVAVSRIAPFEDDAATTQAGGAELTAPARLCQGCRFTVSWSAAGAAAMPGVACNVTLRNALADAAADDAASLGLGVAAAADPALSTSLGLIRAPIGSISAYIPASADVSGERAGAYYVRVSCALGNGTASYLLPMSSAANWTGDSPRFQVTPPAATILVTAPAAGTEFVAGSTDPAYGILSYMVDAPGLPRYPTGRIRITLHHAGHPNGSSTPLATVVTLDPTTPPISPFFVPASFGHPALNELVSDPATRVAFFIRAASVDFPAIAGESPRFSIRPDGEPFFCLSGMAPGPANVTTGASVAELVRTPDGCLDSSAYPASSFALLTLDDAPVLSWVSGSFSGWESVSVYLRTSIAGYEALPLAVGGAAPTVASRSFALPAAALRQSITAGLASRNIRSEYAIELRVSHGSSGVALSVFTPVFQIYANASGIAGATPAANSAAVTRSSLTQLRPPSAAPSGAMLNAGRRFIVGESLELAWASVGALGSGGITFDAMLLTSDPVALASVPESALAPSGVGVLLGRGLPPSGRASLVIPTALANVSEALGANWQLQLSSPDGTHGVRSSFSLRLAPPDAALKLLSPANSSELSLGESVLVQWEAVALVGDLSLQLVYAGDAAGTGLAGGAVSYPFATAAAAAGSFRWSVPAVGSFPFPFGSTSAGLFSLRLTGKGADGTTVEAIAPGLTMRQPQARIAVLQPASAPGVSGGLSLYLPCNITVQWAAVAFVPSATDFVSITIENVGTAPGSQAVSMSLTDHAAPIALVDGFAADLPLPQSLLAGSSSMGGWRVRVASTTAPDVLGESELFTLVAPPQLVRITSPLPGSQIEPTADFRIAYEIDPAVAANASLLQDANVTVTIATTIQYADGSQSTVVTQNTGSLAAGSMNVPLRGGGSLPVVTEPLGSGLTGAGDVTSGGADGGSGGGVRRRLARLAAVAPVAGAAPAATSQGPRGAGAGNGRSLAYVMVTSSSSSFYQSLILSGSSLYTQPMTSLSSGYYTDFMQSYIRIQSIADTTSSLTTNALADTRNVTYAPQDSNTLWSMLGEGSSSIGAGTGGNSSGGSGAMGNSTVFQTLPLDTTSSGGTSGGTGAIISFDANVEVSTTTAFRSLVNSQTNIRQAPRMSVPIFNRRRMLMQRNRLPAERSGAGSESPSGADSSLDVGQSGSGVRALQSFSSSGSSSSASSSAYSYSTSSSTSFGFRPPAAGSAGPGNYYISLRTPSQNSRLWIVSGDVFIILVVPKSAAFCLRPLSPHCFSIAMLQTRRCRSARLKRQSFALPVFVAV